VRDGSGNWWYVVYTSAGGKTKGDPHAEAIAAAKLQVPIKYETGRLADFTGPAWLDGTKSSPELVLNAQDTKNFIALKDILSDVFKDTSSIGGSGEHGGDNYYDIDITVDSISDDYDVEQMANKIKELLYDDAMYRNVNSVSLKR
jgi:hypothetical protein